MEENVRFSVDGMLSALAKYLRALGYDTVLLQDSVKDFFAGAGDDERIIVTLRKKMPESHGCRVIIPPEQPLRAQIRHLIEKIPLRPSKDRLFSRCLRCNVPTVQVDAAAVEDKIPERVKERHTRYRACPNCGKIYWWGSHTDRMISLLVECGAFEKDEHFTRE